MTKSLACLLVLWLLPLPARAVVIRSVALTGTTLTVIDESGTHTLTLSTVPKATSSSAETYISTTWAGTFAGTTYVIAAHVVTLSPFVVMVYVGDVSPPANWWIH